MQEDEDGEEGEPKVDTNNPDEALQSRPIVGLVMMKGFKYDGKGTWQKGTIYDPDNVFHVNQNIPPAGAN